MVIGENGILQQATDAKTVTEKAQIIENAKADILSQQTENKGSNITKEQLATILNKYFKTTASTSIPDEVSSEEGHDLILTTIDEKYNINLSKIFKGSFTSENVVETFGDKYEDSMIGKTINYKSANNASAIQEAGGWIIFGRQINNQGKNDIILTTKNPVGSVLINSSLEGWIGYETVMNNACKNYVGETGTLGTKSATIKEARSMTLDDINRAVGFNETINSITISNSNGGYAYPNQEGTGWIKNTDAEYSSYTFPTEAYAYDNFGGTYNFRSVSTNRNSIAITLENPSNMSYVIADATMYFVASRAIGVFTGYNGRASFNVGMVIYGGQVTCDTNFVCESYTSMNDNYIGNDSSYTFRPCVVLSSETPWEDVKDLIGNYAQYD